MLALLIFFKFFPDLIKEDRLSIVLPPLYGARKADDFIPIYDVETYERLQKEKRNYTFQRFKGLGEVQSKCMRVVLDRQIEHVVRFPKTTKLSEKLIRIITDTEEKRKYLGLLEYNFDDFIRNVLLEEGEKE